MDAAPHSPSVAVDEAAAEDPAPVAGDAAPVAADAEEANANEAPSAEPQAEQVADAGPASPPTSTDPVPMETDVEPSTSSASLPDDKPAKGPNGKSKESSSNQFCCFSK